jgi:hypothetical protein
MGGIINDAEQLRLTVVATGAGVSAGGSIAIPGIGADVFSGNIPMSSSDEILSISDITTPSQIYTKSVTGPLNTVGGKGYGCTVSITVSNGGVATATIVSGGENYFVNDILQILQAGAGMEDETANTAVTSATVENALVTVTAVDSTGDVQGSGAVTALTLVSGKGGSGYVASGSDAITVTNGAITVASSIAGSKTLAILWRRVLEG